jgi:aquaporin Z
LRAHFGSACDRVHARTGGHVSGGHFNPAVTVGVWLNGGMAPEPSTRNRFVRPLGYIVSQLVGGFLGAGIARGINDAGGLHTGFPMVGMEKTAVDGLIAESIMTFALVTVVLFTACSKHSEGNSYFGWAIGMTVFCGACAVGPISGGAFNPAVGTALPAVTNHPSDIWIYWVGPLAGAVAAAFFNRLTNPDRDARTDWSDDTVLLHVTDLEMGGITSTPDGANSSAAGASVYEE